MIKSKLLGLLYLQMLKFTKPVQDAHSQMLTHNKIETTEGAIDHIANLFHSCKFEQHKITASIKIYTNYRGRY